MRQGHARRGQCRHIYDSWEGPKIQPLPTAGGRSEDTCQQEKLRIRSNPGVSGIYTHGMGGSLRCNTTVGLLQHDFTESPDYFVSQVQSAYGSPAADRASICKLIWYDTATDKDASDLHHIR